MNKRERKRQRQEEDLRKAEEDFKWPLLASKTLRAPGAFDDLGISIAGVKIIPNFNGSPERLFCWFILGTAREKRVAETMAGEIEAKARRLLAQTEFPAAAIPSFSFGYACQPDIDAAGGPFNFFR